MWMKQVGVVEKIGWACHQWIITLGLVGLFGVVCPCGWDGGGDGADWLDLPRVDDDIGNGRFDGCGVTMWMGNDI